MDVRREIGLTELTSQAFAPYGTVLGTPLPRASEANAYTSAASAFWRQHLFSADGRDPEILWVAYRDANPHVDRLERHILTEQVVVPLTAPIIQIVAAPRAAAAPDPDSVRAFRVPLGTGLCMKVGCWHATRVPAGEATCLMLTRATTTADLVGHLKLGAPLTESAYCDVALQLSA